LVVKRVVSKDKRMVWKRVVRMVVWKVVGKDTQRVYRWVVVMVVLTVEPLAPQ
jgi:hypothetical protein